MRWPARQEPTRGRYFGAVVPDEFGALRAPQRAGPGRPPVRRRRPGEGRIGSRPIWGRMDDEEIEEVARQAAERRAARFRDRQRFLGRMRGSAEHRTAALETWREVGRGPKVVSAVLAVAVVAAVVLFALPWLKVQRVEVEGSSVVSQQQLLVESGGRWGESTLLLNTSAMASALLAEPWVKAASVQLRWPGTLVLSVTPLPPVLVYQRGSGQQLLAASGAVLGAIPAIPGGELPLLVDQRSRGPAKAGSVVVPARLTQALVALFHVFPAAYGVGLDRCVVTSIGALDIESSVGWTADLGLALTGAQISSIGPKLEALRALAGQVNLKSAGIKEIYLEDPSQVEVSY
ncbi:MAG: FtsQ-type POTRA domain-containing protein [Candidatus Dormibacteria bacterium]